MGVAALNPHFHRKGRHLPEGFFGFRRGGGHRLAAGYTSKAGPLETIRLLTEALREARAAGP